jgi:hypothetical protein
MKLQQKHARIVKEIGKKYGNVIDLERTPAVLIEILREYGSVFANDGGGGGGGGGGVSTVAVGITPPSSEFENAAILKAVLSVQKDVRALSKKLDRLGPAK